jgi:hypothetical protein
MRGGDPAVARDTVPAVTAHPVASAAPAATAGSEEAVQRTFSISILVSATRCLLTYVVLPFVTPLIGLAPNVGPGIGITVGTVALVANGVSIRRFWRADHRLKWPMTFVHIGIMVLLTILVVADLADLLG